MNDLAYGTDYTEVVGPFANGPAFVPLALIGGTNGQPARIVRGFVALADWYADHERYAVQPICHARSTAKGYPIGHCLWRSDRCAWCGETRRRCAGFGG